MHERLEIAALLQMHVGLEQLLRPLHYRRLDALGPNGLGAGTGDPDARLRDLARVNSQHCGHADHREARRGVRELHVGGAHLPGAGGDTRGL